MRENEELDTGNINLFINIIISFKLIQIFKIYNKIEELNNEVSE